MWRQTGVTVDRMQSLQQAIPDRMNSAPVRSAVPMNVRTIQSSDHLGQKLSALKTATRSFSQSIDSVLGVWKDELSGSIRSTGNGSRTASPLHVRTLADQIDGSGTRNVGLESKRAMSPFGMPTMTTTVRAISAVSAARYAVDKAAGSAITVQKFATLRSVAEQAVAEKTTAARAADQVVAQKVTLTRQKAGLAKGVRAGANAADESSEEIAVGGAKDLSNILGIVAAQEKKMSRQVAEAEEREAARDLPLPIASGAARRARNILGTVDEQLAVTATTDTAEKAAKMQIMAQAELNAAEFAVAAAERAACPERTAPDAEKAALLPVNGCCMGMYTWIS